MNWGCYQRISVVRFSPGEEFGLSLQWAARRGYVPITAPLAEVHHGRSAPYVYIHTIQQFEANGRADYTPSISACIQVQGDLRHIVDAGVADVPNSDAGIGVAFLDSQEAFGGAQIWRGSDAHIFSTDLLEEKKLLFRRFGWRLCAQFDAWCIGMNSSGGLRCGGQKA